MLALVITLVVVLTGCGDNTGYFIEVDNQLSQSISVTVSAQRPGYVSTDSFRGPADGHVAASIGGDAVRGGQIEAFDASCQPIGTLDLTFSGLGLLLTVSAAGASIGPPSPDPSPYQEIEGTTSAVC